VTRATFSSRRSRSSSAPTALARPASPSCCCCCSRPRNRPIDGGWFGISQVLPVIVECFYVKPNSTVIFEQPEIHLHPSVQADLADLFIDATRIREDARPRNIQFIIESHSEHFLRRLQRRIAEEEIDHDEIAVYFCEASEDGSTIHRLEIDRLGRIANWPKHFFGDMAAQVRGAINRMKEASDG
jgi:predicted ATPase